MLRLIMEDPISTSYLTDLDTYIIPNVNEEDSEDIINFAYRSDNVQNCEWNNGQVEITCDPFIFQMILLWTYRNGLTSTNKRPWDILRDNGIEESLMIHKVKSYIKEAPDSKARYEIAKNIASWAFGSPNMNDIDDNIDFLVNRFMKGSTLVDRMYMCDTYEELADVLSNCSLKLLMDIERGLCIDEDSISCETDYIRKMYGESKNRLHEQDVEIEVKNKGILEVPKDKNVDDLPMSHFEKLVKKHGLSKITKALNNLQVWNKNDDKKLSKWAGNMIDKLTKKYGKNESRKVYKESSSKSYWKYSVLDPVFNRNEDDDTYLSKYDIRRVKLIPCNNPDECYDSTYSAVCDYEYPYDEFYGTKQDAYDMLLTSWNNSTFERVHDI